MRRPVLECAKPLRVPWPDPIGKAASVWPGGQWAVGGMGKGDSGCGVDCLDNESFSHPT